MPIHNAAFSIAILFLLGVLLGSMGSPSWFVLSATLTAGAALFAVFFFTGERRWLFFSVACPLVFVGFFYYSFHSVLEKPTIHVGVPVVVRGIVARYPEHRPQSQKLDIELNAPQRGEISLTTSAYPRYRYGDTLEVAGIPEKRGDAYAFTFPKITLLAEGGGNMVKKTLFSLKERLSAVFETTLPQKHAALLSGLTFGEDAGFSKEFREALAKSGTSHIVALSGYNIALIVSLVGILFSYFLSKRASFFVTLAVILFFVIMTGGEASVVRAAIMGAIALVAVNMGRIYSFRNAVTFAALLMVLADPRVLLFDIGFQLSFAALLGIIYLLPAIRALFSVSDKKGLLGWRENALTTLSAQFAVTPVLLKHFGTLSLVSLPANVLILGVVPMLTVGGYFLGFLGMISAPLAQIGGWFLYPLLSYVIAVIEFFSAMDLEFSFPMPLWAGVLYYALLGVVIVIANRKIRDMKVSNESGN